jgi:hypothetical protein
LSKYRIFLFHTFLFKPHQTATASLPLSLPSRSACQVSRARLLWSACWVWSFDCTRPCCSPIHLRPPRLCRLHLVLCAVSSSRRSNVECLVKPHHASHYTNITLTRSSYGLGTSRPPSRQRHHGKSPSLSSNPSAFSLQPLGPREIRTQDADRSRRETTGNQTDKAGADW